MKVSISGNIGVGKSSLAEKMAKALPKSLVVPEILEHNPFIREFYSFQAQKSHIPCYNPYSFPNQLLFMKMNYDHERKFTKTNCETTKYFLHDRIMLDAVYVFTHLLHDTKMLTNSEFDLLNSISEDYISEESYPDVLIIIEASTGTLLKRIARRGREMEKEIDEEYLREIDKYYFGFEERIKRGPKKTKVVRVSNEEDDCLESVAGKCCEILRELC